MSTLDLSDFDRYVIRRDDGALDWTQALQAAVEQSERTSALIGIKQPFEIYDTVYYNNLLLLKGPLSGFRTSNYRNYSKGRLVFKKPNGRMFESIPNLNKVIRLQITDLCINYNDIYFADQPNRPSSSLFYNFRIADHSIIERCNFQSFDWIFENSSIGEASRLTRNTFRELGKGFFNGPTIGDSFFDLNYFNGSVWAEDGAKCFVSANTNMCKFTGNWFEFMHSCFSGYALHNTYSNNTFDYIYRPFNGGLDINCKIDNSTFNNCNKDALIKFRNLSETSEMKTGEWINILTNPVRGLIVSKSTANESEQLIVIDSKSCKDIKTRDNVLTRTSGTVPEEKVVRLNIPASAENISIGELDNNNYDLAPTTNLYAGRRAFIKGLPIYLDKTLTWMDGDIPYGFGGDNILPAFDDTRWIKNTNHVKDIIYSDNNRVLTFTTIGTYKDFAIIMNVSEGDKFFFTARTEDGNLMEVWFMNSSNTKIGSKILKGMSKNIFTCPVGTVTLQIRLRGEKDNTTYTFSHCSLVKYDEQIRSLNISESTGKYKVKVVDGVLTPIKLDF